MASSTAEHPGVSHDVTMFAEGRRLKQLLPLAADPAHRPSFRVPEALGRFFLGGGTREGPRLLPSARVLIAGDARADFL